MERDRHGDGDRAPAPPTPAASSFGEVLRLVRSGQEPPGVRRPRASPTGDSPTASRGPPPAKPWESRPRPAGPSCSQRLENEEPPPLSTHHPGGSSGYRLISIRHISIASDPFGKCKPTSTAPHFLAIHLGDGPQYKHQINLANV
ncbi:uncharacterized protein C6orf226 homolog [Rissa tridactyla]|uniref:uncharacterized protein C6orf226 homolog n=1 Tax=Rissa tridactyla TaxID=75485 RepID=UPI0023BA6B0A|nr:uncharacterized protein C6orf226 homolog [Rissa tridactyla]